MALKSAVSSAMKLSKCLAIDRGGFASFWWYAPRDPAMDFAQDCGVRSVRMNLTSGSSKYSVMTLGHR